MWPWSFDRNGLKMLMFANVVLLLVKIGIFQLVAGGCPSLSDCAYISRSVDFRITPRGEIHRVLDVEPSWRRWAIPLPTWKKGREFCEKTFWIHILIHNAMLYICKEIYDCKCLNVYLRRTKLSLLK